MKKRATGFSRVIRLGCLYIHGRLQNCTTLLRLNDSITRLIVGELSLVAGVNQADVFPHFGSI